MDNDALRMIAEQQRIKNVMTAIKLQAARYKYETPEQYIEIMKSVALDALVDEYNVGEDLDSIHQIAFQMRLENTIDAIAFLMSRTQVPAEENEYRERLEEIINSYSKDKRKKI